MESTYDLIILGAGPAGLTAGIYAARAKLRTLILGTKPGGKPLMYEQIGNYPGFPGGVTGAQLMTAMLQQVSDLNVEQIWENASALSLGQDYKEVLVGSQEYLARALIVATGSDPIPLEVPGASEYEGRGIYYCAHCDAPVFRIMEKSRAAVVGGGDSALYTALYLTKHAQEVTVVHRGPGLRGSKAVQEAVLSHPRIRILLNREVVEVKGDRTHVSSLILRNAETDQETQISTEGVFVGIGQKPNSKIVEGLLELDRDGFILVNGRMESSAPGVFAAGDVIQKSLRQIVTAASDGAVAADSATKFLQGMSA